MEIVAIGFNRNSLAVKVSGAPSRNLVPHVTVACAPFAKPVDSNYIGKWVELSGLGNGVLVQSWARLPKPEETEESEKTETGKPVEVQVEIRKEEVIQEKQGGVLEKVAVLGIEEKVERIERKGDTSTAPNNILVVEKIEQREEVTVNINISKGEVAEVNALEKSVDVVNIVQAEKELIPKGEEEESEKDSTRLSIKVNFPPTPILRGTVRSKTMLGPKKPDPPKNDHVLPKGVSVGDFVKKYHPHLQGKEIGNMVKKVLEWIKTSQELLDAAKVEEFVQSLVS